MKFKLPSSGDMRPEVTITIRDIRDGTPHEVKAYDIGGGFYFAQVLGEPPRWPRYAVTHGATGARGRSWPEAVIGLFVHQIAPCPIDASGWTAASLTGDGISEDEQRRLAEWGGTIDGMAALAMLEHAYRGELVEYQLTTEPALIFWNNTGPVDMDVHLGVMNIAGPQVMFVIGDRNSSGGAHKEDGEGMTIGWRPADARRIAWRLLALADKADDSLFPVPPAARPGAVEES